MTVFLNGRLVADDEARIDPVDLSPDEDKASNGDESADESGGPAKPSAETEPQTPSDG